MRYLTTAALALVLAAGAVAASADPQDNNGGHASHGGDQGGGHGSGQGGHEGGGGHAGGGHEGGGHEGGQGGARGGGQPGALPAVQGSATAHTVTGPAGGGFRPGPGVLDAGPQNLRDYGRRPGGYVAPTGGAAATGGGDGHHGVGDHHGGDWHGGDNHQGGGAGAGGWQGGDNNHHGGGGWQGGDNNHHSGGDWHGDNNHHGGDWHGGGNNFHQGPGGGFVQGGIPGRDHALRGRDRGRNWYNDRSFPEQFRAHHRFHDRWDHRPRGWYARTWSFGDFLPFGWFTPDFYLDYEDYGLPYPPVGCEWVREGDDAVLVNVWTGEVLSVAYGVFW